MYSTVIPSGIHIIPPIFSCGSPDKNNIVNKSRHFANNFYSLEVLVEISFVIAPSGPCLPAPLCLTQARGRYPRKINKRGSCILRCISTNRAFYLSILNTE